MASGVPRPVRDGWEDQTSDAPRCVTHGQCLAPWTAGRDTEVLPAALLRRTATHCPFVCCRDLEFELSFISESHVLSLWGISIFTTISNDYFQLLCGCLLPFVIMTFYCLVMQLYLFDVFHSQILL